MAGLPTIVIEGKFRLLDEVVCRAFHGSPPYADKGLKVPRGSELHGVTVTHKDGDMLNCAAANVAWRIDPQWLVEHYWRPLMRPDHLPTKRLRPPPARRILNFGA